MKRNRLGWVASLWLAMLATGAQAVPVPEAKPCIPGPEAEALLLALAPEFLRSIGQACAAQLPPDALLRRLPPEFIGKYQSAADRSWPLAKEALVKIAGPDMRTLMENDAAKPLMLSLIGPVLGAKIKPEDCAGIERIVGYIAPLPAENMSGLLIAILEFTQRDKSDKPDKMSICPVEVR